MLTGGQAGCPSLSPAGEGSRAAQRHQPCSAGAVAQCFGLTVNRFILKRIIHGRPGEVVLVWGSAMASCQTPPWQLLAASLPARRAVWGPALQKGRCWDTNALALEVQHHQGWSEHSRLCDLGGPYWGEGWDFLLLSLLAKFQLSPSRSKPSGIRLPNCSCF